MGTGFWSRSYMKIKATFAFFFNTFFFCMMSTDATITVNLYTFYATHFSNILCMKSDKNDRSIVYIKYELLWSSGWSGGLSSLRGFVGKVLIFACVPSGSITCAFSKDAFEGFGMNLPMEQMV
jgi:hypothetical protein